MAGYDFNAPRLFVESSLAPGARIELDRGQANYLLNVLRLRDGGAVLVFNGADGEWRAEIEVEGRKSASLVARELTRAQESGPDLLYLFAPLKHARLDYMIQKAVEMGASALRPVFTRRTQSQRVNLERMRANAVEAAEQCGILTLPAILGEEDLGAALKALEPDRLLIFCDEDAPLSNPVEALTEAKAKLTAKVGNSNAKVAVIIGPEGGFTDEERALVAAHSPCYTRIVGAADPARRHSRRRRPRPRPGRPRRLVTPRGPRRPDDGPVPPSLSHPVTVALGPPMNPASRGQRRIAVAES